MMEQKTIRVGRQVRNPTRNQKEPANDDWNLTRTRRNQEMMMEQNAKSAGHKPRNPTGNQKIMVEQRLFLGRIENPIQLQSCFGKKEKSTNVETLDASYWLWLTICCQEDMYIECTAHNTMYIERAVHRCAYNVIVATILHAMPSYAWYLICLSACTKGAAA